MASVLSFSVALALLAAGAYVIGQLSGGGRAIVVAAWVTGLGALVASVANVIEDGLGVSAFGQIFSLGVLGIIAGLFGLAILLTSTRRWFLACLAAATLIGVFGSNEAGGGYVILAAWSIAAVRLVRLGGTVPSTMST